VREAPYNTIEKHVEAQPKATGNTNHKPNTSVPIEANGIADTLGKVDSNKITPLHGAAPYIPIIPYARAGCIKLPR